MARFLLAVAIKVVLFGQLLTVLIKKGICIASNVQHGRNLVYRTSNAGLKSDTWVVFEISRNPQRNQHHKNVYFDVTSSDFAPKYLYLLPREVLSAVSQTFIWSLETNKVLCVIYSWPLTDSNLYCIQFSPFSDQPLYGFV